MKKLSFLIIFIFSFFSIFNFTNWYYSVKSSLDLPYWPEIDEILNINKIWNYKFRNNSNKKWYNFIKNNDNIIRKKFIEKYQNWEFSKANISWIENTYSLFIYHTNKYFKYLSMKENGKRFKDLNLSINNNYKLSRIYFDELLKFSKK